VLNKLPCVVADRFLEKVDEVVEVLNVCQDEYNPSVVWMTFSLNGVFDYTPTCWILEVDGDKSFTSNGIKAPIYLSYYRNTISALPINTNCQTKTYILAFDFGVVIQKYLGSSDIKFKLEMAGVLPANLDIPDFKDLSKTISHTYGWSKGPTPNPYALQYNNETKKLSIYFDFNSGYPCTCNIACQAISGNINSIQYCADKISQLVVDYKLSDDPQTILLKFSDPLGNFKNLDIRPLTNIRPVAPMVSYLANPKRVEIGVSKSSLGGAKLEDSAYQIWKYENTDGTLAIWKDWSYRDNTAFTDMMVVPGNTYGYAVRYKGKFGEESALSDWTTIDIPLL
jgi:hypothetical protein